MFLPADLKLSSAALAAVVLFTLYYIYWQLTVGSSRRRLINQHGCKPVKRLAQKDPILGLDTFIANAKSIKAHTMLPTLNERYKEMGNTWGLNLLGDIVVTTIEPENLKAIQSLNFKDWSLGTRRKDAFFPLLGHGIFTTDGNAWRHSRNLLRPNFIKHQVGDLQTFQHHVDNLIAAIPTDGSTVDLQDLFFRLTIDSATDFLFGQSTNSLAPGISKEPSTEFAKHWNNGLETLARRQRYGAIYKLVRDPQFKEDCAYVQNFVDKFVQLGLSGKKRDEEKAEGKYVFLDALVQQTSDPVVIRSELLNILLAGRDTTASLLSNVWWTLSRSPEIWSKLRAEVDGLRGEPPTYDDIKSMKYLKWVLNESLRLHPVVPVNLRTAEADTVLPRGGGPDGRSPILIKKGQRVSWSVYSMHRREDFYGKDAEEFKPERWETLRPGWEYLPFNGGSRICLGQQFALTEASYTTIRLMQAFKHIESRDPEPFTEWLTLTCTGWYGCKVALTA